MSDNWVVQNLENALETWNSKLSEIWQLLTTSPQEFKGGSIWSVMVNINGAVQAIGLALLVLFFVVGVVRTCGSFTDVKKPEHALKLFIRFAIAKGVIIRSVTVQAINLIPQDTPRQIDMFMDAAKQDKLERMEKCVEEIRRRFGKDSIRNGVLCQNLRLPPEKAEITMPTGMVG